MIFYIISFRASMCINSLQMLLWRHKFCFDGALNVYARNVRFLGRSCKITVIFGPENSKNECKIILLEYDGKVLWEKEGTFAQVFIFLQKLIKQ